MIFRLADMFIALFAGALIGLALGHYDVIPLPP